jgi:hypothetical protein
VGEFASANVILTRVAGKRGDIPTTIKKRCRSNPAKGELCP